VENETPPIAEYLIPPLVSWNRSYEGAVVSIVGSGDGGFVMIGDSQYSSTSRWSDDVFVQKIDRLGDEVWKLSLQGAGLIGAPDIVRTLDGGFIIIGPSWIPHGVLEFGVREELAQAMRAIEMAEEAPQPDWRYAKGTLLEEMKEAYFKILNGLVRSCRWL
jgi:hypothetical protein